MREVKTLILALTLFFISGDSSVFAEGVVASLQGTSALHSQTTESEARIVETEAVLGDSAVLIQATAQLVSKVAELRTEFELLRLGLLASNKGTKPACLSCQIKDEWRALPLGALAPLRVENALCSEASDKCPDEAAFRARAFAGLSRPLSGLERLSCDYLLKQQGESSKCPSALGEFYSCSAICD
jgi:hypothetical protein